MIAAAGWLVVLGIGLVALSSTLGISRPVVVVLAQSLMPVLTIPLLLVGLVAALSGHWWLFGLVVVAALELVVVVVRGVRPSAPLRPPGTVGSVRVLGANLLHGNARKGRAVEALIAADADVLALVEVTSGWVEAFRDGGLLDKYPHHILDPVDRRGTGAAVLSRVRVLNDEPVVGAPSLVVEAGSERLRVVAVHTQCPMRRRLRDRWWRQLTGVGQLMATMQGPFVFIGDFNATYWHAPFRRLLSGGVSDAHAALGRGLSFSWPIDRRLSPPGPFTRLDHALVSDQVGVVSVVDVVIPGSDHRGLVVYLAVGA